jgi:hypothetical protein
VDGKAAINAAGGPKAVSGSRDLFSLVLRANMSADIPDDHRMSDNEVIGRLFCQLIKNNSRLKYTRQKFLLFLSRGTPQPGGFIRLRAVIFLD